MSAPGKLHFRLSQWMQIRKPLLSSFCYQSLNDWKITLFKRGHCPLRSNEFSSWDVTSEEVCVKLVAILVLGINFSSQMFTPVYKVYSRLIANNLQFTTCHSLHHLDTVNTGFVMLTSQKLIIIIFFLHVSILALTHVQQIWRTLHTFR